MADLNAYTVVDRIAIPHCEEGAHEHFGPCPDCDDKGMQEVRDGLYRKCPTCKGTREGGPSLGMQPCSFPMTHYLPGQTLHLSEQAAERYLREGVIAPAGAGPVAIEELQVRAAAARLGLKLAD